MAVISVLITGSLIAIIEAPALFKKRMFKELSFFAVILFTGIALSMLQVLRISLPNPLDWIISVHKPTSDAILRMLE